MGVEGWGKETLWRLFRCFAMCFLMVYKPFFASQLYYLGIEDYSIRISRKITLFSRLTSCEVNSLFNSMVVDEDSSSLLNFRTNKFRMFPSFLLSLEERVFLRGKRDLCTVFNGPMVKSVKANIRDS